VDRSFIDVARGLLVQLDLTYAMETFDAPAIRSILDLFDRHYIIVKPENMDALSKLLTEEAALNPWMPLTNDLLQGYQVTADQLSNRLLREEPFNPYGSNVVSVRSLAGWHAA
jgi:hypothetical protein